MAQAQKLFHRQTNSVDAITVGAVTITPQSQVLIARWPFGSWIWNRPVSVIIQRGEQSQTIPIIDLTRLIQLSLLGSAVLFFIIGLMVSSERR
jgi:hypothetical protein